MQKTPLTILGNYKKATLPYSKIGSIPAFFIVGLINLYQWTLSPDHGVPSLYTVGVCKFRPTCSEYTKQAIIKEGVVKGFKKGIKQIKQCH